MLTFTCKFYYLFKIKYHPFTYYQVKKERKKKRWKNKFLWYKNINLYAEKRKGEKKRWTVGMLLFLRLRALLNERKKDVIIGKWRMFSRKSGFDMPQNYSPWYLQDTWMRLQVLLYSSPTTNLMIQNLLDWRRVVKTWKKSLPCIDCPYIENVIVIEYHLQKHGFKCMTHTFYLHA